MDLGIVAAYYTTNVLSIIQVTATLFQLTRRLVLIVIRVLLRASVEIIIVLLCLMFGFMGRTAYLPRIELDVLDHCRIALLRKL